MTKQEIKNNLDAIRRQLDIPVAQGDPVGAMEKLEKLGGIMGLSAECHANAERLYNQRLADLVQENASSPLNTTDKKLLFQGKLAEEIHLMTLAEQYSKKIDKSIEALRSVLSYLKQEIRNV